MARGCLVLVDGWNHYVTTRACLGYSAARSFPIDRLAAHVANQTGEETLVDVAVVMALPNQKQPGEEPEFMTWRKRLRGLRNAGVRHVAASFRYSDMSCADCGTPIDRKVVCPHCAHVNPFAGRRKEKGADIKLATLALNGAWRQDYSTLVILSQDSDFGPLVNQLKEVHLEQGRRYALYSAFPVCDRAAHDHRGVPGTRPIHLDAATYATCAGRPRSGPAAARPQL
ncbi:NYN domain-containing protein [Dactylosporangium roseum]|uniref:NYN domain-containing protein n=1 Tax=Dactylosporangium roseum TaxID=47989 RepID=A0ABY5Z3Z6_9ACTN|nr:NYN domain-containing protein [Dactylosporangium roseum]UWZ36187.1 NYN domain-containing protein [Dactylosporangium roseum]